MSEEDRKILLDIAQELRDMFAPCYESETIEWAEELERIAKTT